MENHDYCLIVFIGYIIKAEFFKLKIKSLNVFNQLMLNRALAVSCMLI